MVQKRLQILISAVNKDPKSLIPSMKLESDAVLVNQLIGEGAPGGIDESEYTENFEGLRVTVLNKREKGVGLSRNTALMHSDREIIQFGDDDIVYEEGYAERIIAEFDAHPEADVLLFNVRAQEGRETYWNSDFARVSWMNYGRYPAYAICARRDELIKSGVKYSLLFGGGAPYMNGEDSLFLHDCLKAGLFVYRTPVALGHEKKSGSTWFKGFNDKFFYDRGVLYHFLYGGLAPVWGFRFLFKNRKEMCADLGLLKCYGLLLKGIRHGRTIR
jgi:glycosyltransferase involved in cell wall biosynthesis